MSFVWAPNAVTEGPSDFTNCYPGTKFVDYLGLDGYNLGTVSGHQWQSAEKHPAHSIAALGTLTPDRPILITELDVETGITHSSRHSEYKIFPIIEANDRVSSFVCFQMDEERDWRFDSSPASTVAFRYGLARWMRR